MREGTMTVGFIGLGTMGAPMARNVLDKGHALIVLDVVQDAVAKLVAAGARAASTPKDVAAASDVVITMLPDAPDVERVALGKNGIVEGIRPGSVYIDMSTIDPDTTRKIGAEIAAAGASMIDCPVGKTADHAVAGTLTLMVGGPAEVVARCRPLLDCMGSDFFHCGELGAGQTMKLINNLLATAVSEASIEALVTGTKSGLSLDTMTSVLRTTMAWNNALAISLPKRPLAGDFKPGFMVKLAHKDCRLALSMTERLGVRAPVGRAALASVDEAMQKGLQDDDVGALLKLREEQAGVKVRQRST
ncbi:MAG TPA: NAD(P)-dependent oxidoreductase [Casimicrobiaceae bacterium]|nr:NAD(P)-dependent oxidoreductase [Casimicrobiaceae bacterium]